jgi:hypothetical protein
MTTTEIFDVLVRELTGSQLLLVQELLRLIEVDSRQPEPLEQTSFAFESEHNGTTLDGLIAKAQSAFDMSGRKRLPYLYESHHKAIRSLLGAGMRPVDIAKVLPVSAHIPARIKNGLAPTPRPNPIV